jgi:hypothetical protein
MSQDIVLGWLPRISNNSFQWISLPRTTPDFLYAALDTSAYAAFFTESRTRLSDSTYFTGNPGPSWAILRRPYGTDCDLSRS